MSTAVDAASYVNSNYTMPKVNSENSALGKDAFYTLLLTEVKNQDPTEPMDSTDMINQMAQFATLESSQNLNDNMENYIGIASMSTASSLIGQTVVYYDKDAASYYYGTATGVSKGTDGYNVIVDGYEVSIDNVSKVYAAGTTNTGTTTTNPTKNQTTN